MYYFDNTDKSTAPSSYTTPNTHSNVNDSNRRYENDPNDYAYSQSFTSSSFHQPHSLDDSYSFLNWDPDSHNSLPPSAFIQDVPSSSLGQDSFLAQGLEGIYGSSFSDNMQHDQGQMFLPLASNNYDEQQPGNTDIFSSLTDQEKQAILMSDPNFLRQQHLLQNNNKMKMELEEQQDDSQQEDMNLSHHADSPMRSNLTALFDHQSSADRPPYSTQSSSQPQMTTKSPLSSNITTSTNNKLRKETNRRSQPGNGARGNNRLNPIPINAGSASTSGPITKHSSVPTEIDHQRRFNELQARFRVNYGRKPTTASSSSITSPSQQQQQHSQHHDLSSSYSGGFGTNRNSHDFTFQSNNNGAASAATFGSSMPTSMEKSHMELAFAHARGATDKDTAHSNSGTKSSALSASTIPVKGITIPKDSNSSTSGAMKQAASSFPTRTMPIQIHRVHRTNVSQPVDAEQQQKRLDDQLVKTNFDDITVSELKEMLRQRGKPATGKKAILLQRLADERDIIHAVRSGRLLHRHSQPPATPTLSGDPSSLDSSNNMAMIGASSQQQQNYSSLDSPSSVPNSSMFLSSSPGSVTLSLNRSIADMHIGSPPMPQQHSRRFSPYNTPGSPRASPKMQATQPAYSSSMPTHYHTPSLSSSPNISHDAMMMPASSASSRNNNMRFYNQNWNGRPRSYAPFTSSALATPDRENDDDPFDRMMAMARDTNPTSQPPLQHDQPLYDNLYQNTNGMDTGNDAWSNHTSAGEASLHAILQDLPEGVSIDQFLTWLADNGDQFNTDSMKMDTDGMHSYPDGPLYDDPQ